MARRFFGHGSYEDQVLRVTDAPRRSFALLGVGFDESGKAIDADQQRTYEAAKACAALLTRQTGVPHCLEVSWEPLPAP